MRQGSLMTFFYLLCISALILCVRIVRWQVTTYGPKTHRETPPRVKLEPRIRWSIPDDIDNYEVIPAMNNLTLERGLLDTEQRNIDIERNLRGSDLADKTLNELLSEVSYYTPYTDNRLLNKLVNEAKAQDDTEGRQCVVKILQMCSEMCKNTIGNRSMEWVTFPCRFSGCRFQTKFHSKEEDLLESDVVIFLPEGRDWQRLIARRPAGQLWVVHSKESPIHWPDFSPPREYGNPFNLSIMYLSDADIAPAYFYLDSRIGESEPAVMQKKKLMAWMSSNCNNTSWGRHALVNALQQHLPIDTFGRCGTKQCPRYESLCRELTKHYKFYLAFENSLCPEYITEKFWFNALSFGSVPIVYGAPKEDYERFAPPHSFIHLDDFPSLKDFTKYINLLDNDDRLYLQYFAWRRLGRVQKSSRILTNRVQSPPMLCYIIRTLVKKSLKLEEWSWKNQHPNFYDWWNGMCNREKQPRTVMDIDVRV
ncbi:alpha-(1,3)-fucosyltransferase 7-like [Diadema setosum]|uniref:alpha-(1,3)-fucosyltransferase 7-like n=1 Tax=Diadema setosum TaxID=31175 RepID=UPI003B3B8419